MKHSLLISDFLSVNRKKMIQVILYEITSKRQSQDNLYNIYNMKGKVKIYLF